MKKIFCALPVLLMSVVLSVEAAPLRIMPVGDSITRGSHLVVGNMTANPQAGGYRKPLQDKLRAAGFDYEFVGELDYWAYGKDGVVDPGFQPRHHGLAGFSNRAIRLGGVVPTPQMDLDRLGVTELRVPGIVEVIEKWRPDVILLMSGTNGFDEKERDLLIRTICDNFTGVLFVANIPPQKPPRGNVERVDEYNASLPEFLKTLTDTRCRVYFVDINSALDENDILGDGVHPDAGGLEKMSEAWFRALMEHRGELGQ